MSAVQTLLAVVGLACASLAFSIFVVLANRAVLYLLRKEER